MQCGFVGLGHMGGAIAGRLLASGVQMHVFDLDGGRLKQFGESGAVVHSSGRAVGDASEVVFTCLPGVAPSHEAIFGDRGIAEGGGLRHLVEMSTIGKRAMQDIAQRLAARNVGVLDAPVSGGAAGARAGTLAIMVSGPAPVMLAVEPFLQRISSRILPISASAGDAQTMKLVNNLLAAANMATAFEALTLATQLNLDPARVVEVVNLSSGRNSGFDERKMTAVLTGSFDVGGHISLLDKDIRLAFDEATDAGVSPDVFSALSGMSVLWRRAVAQGMAGQDVSRLIELVRRDVQAIATAEKRNLR